MKSRSHVQLPQYISQLQGLGQYWFLQSELQKALELSSNAMTKALGRLAKKKRVCRIRGDFYVIVPLEYQASGCLPPEWFIDAFMQYLKLDYYVALLTAASFEGAAHQQIMEFQVITDGKVRVITAGNQRITFYYKKQLPTNFLRKIKSPASYFKSSTAELTAFDLVRYINVVGQLNAVATVLYELSEKLNVSILCALIQSGAVILPVAQRLGYILDVINKNITLDNLEKTINAFKPKYIPLVFAPNKEIIERNKRWHVLVNEPIDMDEL